MDPTCQQKTVQAGGGSVMKSGCGSLVVKVMDSWPSCHEFEPGAFEDPPSRVADVGQIYRSQNILFRGWGVNVKRGGASSGVVLVT
ncbi:hypothetical protein TNCV_2044531 [Trichonephila clavipes]|nr:hypothetical protein TNCV_2044531 [Trichonephila clavipes]